MVPLQYHFEYFQGVSIIRLSDVFLQYHFEYFQGVIWQAYLMVPLQYHLRYFQGVSITSLFDVFFFAIPLGVLSGNPLTRLSRGSFTMPFRILSRGPIISLSDGSFAISPRVLSRSFYNKPLGRFLRNTTASISRGSSEKPF